MAVHSPPACAEVRLAWLADAASRAEIHSVRVGWSDRLGAWRGKRVPVEDFLADPGRRVGFCDGMLVADVQAGVIEATPFSNFSTGYPDMYLQPDLETLRPVTWAGGEAFVLGELQSHHGVPLALAPRAVLDRVVERLALGGTSVRVRLRVCGRLMGPGGEVIAPDARLGLLQRTVDALRDADLPAESVRSATDGRFSIALGSLAARAAGEGAFLTKAALKEMAQAHDLVATFMTLSPGAAAPSRLGIEIESTGDREAPRADDVRSRLADVRALLQPSVNAFKAGAALAPDGALTASSEADPLTALAVVLAALYEDSAAPLRDQAHDLAAAADRLAAAAWVVDWLGAEFVANAVELLRHEARLYAAAVTDWELARYWRQA